MSGARCTASFSNLIDGEPCAAVSGRTIDVVDPADGAVFTTLPRSDERDIDAAVAAARGAFDGAFGRLTATERGRILLRLSALILEHQVELAELECRDTGKPIQQARADITACARYFEYYGGAADKLHGETIPYAAGQHGDRDARAARRHRPHHSRGTIRRRSSAARSAAPSPPAMPASSSRPRTPA